MNVTKNWLSRAFALLDNSLQPVPQELNEIDWKENLSPNTVKLTQHLSAFANHPGGGILVFGIEDKSGSVLGIRQQAAEEIMGKLSSVGRDSLYPMVVSIIQLNCIMINPCCLFSLKNLLLSLFILNLNQ